MCIRDREGEGFMRLNAGCPRSILERALSQLEEAYENRGFRHEPFVRVQPQHLSLIHISFRGKGQVRGCITFQG